MTDAATTVKMFTTTWCGFCKGTKRYLDSKGVTYEEIDIEQHPEYGEKIEQETGGFRTVPTLEIGGKLYVNPSRRSWTACSAARRLRAIQPLPDVGRRPRGRSFEGLAHRSARSLVVCAEAVPLR